MKQQHFIPITVFHIITHKLSSFAATLCSMTCLFTAYADKSVSLYLKHNIFTFIMTSFLWLLIVVTCSSSLWSFELFTFTCWLVFMFSTAIEIQSFVKLPCSCCASKAELLRYLIEMWPKFYITVLIAIMCEQLLHVGESYVHNLVIELVTRADLERNKFADVVSSLSAVVGICVDDAFGFADRLLIIIGWHISVIGRIVLALRAVDVVNERHLAMSKFKSFRCPARPAAAKGNGTNRWSTWNLCSSRYFFEQKHR